MLRTLSIDNYALIDQSHIEFAPGFVVITGETGAGKSIMLGALALLLGQRADTQVLRDASRKCVVEASFDISTLGLKTFFESNDLDYDDTLILRREILPSAKSRAFVNDSPVSLSVLKDLAPRLIDIHSQHQTLTLSDSSFQIALLDALATDSTVLPEYQSAFREYISLKRKLEQLTAEEAQNRKALDYNQFLFDELSQARLDADEQQQLEEESNLLANSESIKMALSCVQSLLGDENAVISLLNSAKSQLSHSADCLPALNELYERLDSSLIELQDVLSEANSLDDRVQYSPERQQQVDERLDLLYRLQKKHGVESVASLIEIRDELDEKLQSVLSLDQQIHDAMEAVDNAFSHVQSLAEKLTNSRTVAAAEIESQLLPILSDLGMKEARMNVNVVPTEHFSSMGRDQVTFLFNANRGGELRELSKVASGGELSRLMLALKSIVVKASLLPTIIFDEIDTGISGDISMRVGHILAQMSKSMQVIAISHMPQIAARASQHLKVYKRIEEDSTVSHIRQLNDQERVNEIAMMLSSENPTESALKTARELMLSH